MNFYGKTTRARNKFLSILCYPWTLFILGGNFPKKGRYLEQRYVKIIDDLIGMIENDLTVNLNIAEIAHKYDISPWHFQRVFKSIAGDSLGNYIRGRRLTRAAQLLTESKMNIVDIAFFVGFNSHGSFTKSFKAYFDVSPKEFRKARPPVIFKKKPLLSHDLIKYWGKRVKPDPEIVSLPAQIIIGMNIELPSPFVGKFNYAEVLIPFWESFAQRRDEIDSIIPNKFIGITFSPSGNYDEETAIYMAGVPVSHATNIPEGMSQYRIPEQKVAIFDISGKCESVAKTVDFVYGLWLSNSPYERGDGVDYELFDNQYLQNGNSRYIIPIKDKI